MEFELETAAFATDQHPVFHVIVAHEGGDRFSFIMLNTSIEPTSNHFGGELRCIYEETFEKLMNEKLSKFRACMAFSRNKSAN